MKTIEISKQIMAEYAINGNDIKAAFDKVIGSGAYDKLASDLYDAMKS